VISKVVEVTLDVEGWAATQPVIDVDERGDQLKMVLSQHLENATDMLSKAMGVAGKQLKLLLGEMSSDKLHHSKVTECASYPTSNPNKFCRDLGHRHVVDVQFRDVHFAECRVNDAVEMYLQISKKKDFQKIVKSHPVCDDSLRDLTCLRALPLCRNPCNDLTPCRVACRNINTCATTLGLKDAYDCDVECACLNKCSSFFETTKEMREETQTCMTSCKECSWTGWGCKTDKECSQKCIKSPEERVELTCSRQSRLLPKGFQAKYEPLFTSQIFESNSAAPTYVVHILSGGVFVLMGLIVARAMSIWYPMGLVRGFVAAPAPSSHDQLAVE